MTQITVPARQYNSNKYSYPVIIDDTAVRVTLKFNCWLPALLRVGAIVVTPRTIRFTGPRRFPSGNERRPAWLVAHEVAHVWQIEDRGLIPYLWTALWQIVTRRSHATRYLERQADVIGHAIQHGVCRPGQGYPVEIEAPWIAARFPAGDNPVFATGQKM